MKQLIVALCCMMVCTFVVSPAFAQSDAEFAKANANYAAGHFQEAVNGYETLVRSGEWSANLFYNLGNAYFRVGDFGHAILNYARALEMQSSWPERYFQFGSLSQYSVVAAVAFWLGMFCVFRLIFGRRRAAAIVALSILSFSTFVIAAFAIYKLENGNNGRALAIVTGTGVEARFATADSANSVLALPPGSEIKILSTRGDWIYGALPNNLRGWLPAKSAELVRL